MVSRTPFALIFALWGAGLGGAAQYGKMSVSYEVLPAVYPDGGAALGLVVSLVGFVGIFFGVVAGVLVGRIRYRRALLFALWLGAGVSMAQTMLPPLPWMLASRVLEGVSHLGIVVAAPTLIAQLAAEKDRGFCLTLWGTFFGVAFAVLAWAGRPLIDAFGLPALFAAHGVYMAGFALYLARKLRALPDPRSRSAISVRQVLRDHVTIYRSPAIAAPALGWLFYTFCFVSVLTLLPQWIDPASRVTIMGLMPLASIVSSMTLGVWLLRKTSAVGVVCLGFGLSVLAMGWLWAIPGGAAPAIALAGALGLVQGASFAAVPQLNASAASQAQANGAMAQMGNIGNTLGTPVMAAVIAGMGYNGLPVLAGLMLIAGLMVHLLLARQRNVRL